MVPAMGKLMASTTNLLFIRQGLKLNFVLQETDEEKGLMTLTPGANFIIYLLK